MCLYTSLIQSYNNDEINNSLPINLLLILSHSDAYKFECYGILHKCSLDEQRRQNEWNIIMIINIQVKVSNIQVHFQI